MKTEKADVTLKYTKPTIGQSGKWRMDIGKGEKEPGNYDKLVVGRGDDGIFVFEIKTSGVKFNATDPIDINLHKGEADMSGQFMWKVIDDDEVLIVADPNRDSEPAEYYYKLNFIGAPSLDPVITNGCCKSFVGTPVAGPGPGGIQLMSATGAIVVLVVSLVLASLYIAITRWAK